jgi:hypothetical protein
MYLTHRPIYLKSHIQTHSCFDLCHSAVEFAAPLSNILHADTFSECDYWFLENKTLYLLRVCEIQD